MGDRRATKTEQAISRVRDQIAIGMPRSEVEERVSKLPDLYQVYTPHDQIIPPEDRQFQGTPLSGRLTVSTPLEIDGLGKASGHVVIEFDQNDRVVNVRVGGFGFGDRS
ncbi:MAG TPA: hypothetical protein VMU39_17805 [Solirubrobacteraceae bacterium]|nr:hypothetical protein [Solirubrobacteraceae bacterium]